MGEEKEYLVRGALLSCDFGSHPRRLNLLKSHGIYIKDHPMIMDSDCIVDENITYFGVCSSPCSCRKYLACGAKFAGCLKDLVIEMEE